MNVIILNNLPIETGIGRSVYNLFLTLKDDWVRVMNFPNSYDYKTKNFDEEIYGPKFRNRILNTAFLKLSHRNASREIRGFDGFCIMHQIPCLFSNLMQLKQALCMTFPLSNTSRLKRGLINILFVRREI